MRLCRITKLAFVSIVSVLLVWMLSPAIVIPPTDPTEPVVIFITDRGWHSRLVLPTGNGEFVQYAYGDWNYFALNQQDLKSGITALFMSTQSTLGRSKFSSFAQLQQIVQQQDYTLLRVEVAQTKVTQLLKSLDKRFNQNIATSINNSQTGLTLVKDDGEYTLLHNSNHQVVEWLQDLDCQIHGFVMWANFQVKY